MGTLCKSAPAGLVYDSLYVRYTLVDTNVVGFEEFLVDTASDTIFLYNTGRIGLEKQNCDTGCVTAFDILTNSPVEYMLIDCRQKGHFIDERIYYDLHGNPVKSVFYKHGEIYKTEEY